MRTLRSTPAPALLFLLGIALTGCGFSGTQLTPPTPIPITPTPPTPPVTGSYTGVSFSGKVLAGRTPIAGSSVQLYATGATGNGIAAGFLLAIAPITDATGSFTVPAGYSCPLATTQVYLVATGGATSSTATSSNPAITLLTAVGSCNQIATTSQFTVNEVTTVAAAFALAQFLAPGAAIGASATNATGLANAFLIAASLASPATGATPGPTFPANAISPAARIDSLANLLNTCTAGASSNCAALFAATKSASSNAPANTLDAALALSRNPAANVAALYNQSQFSTAFTPALTAAPSDWTLFVTFSGGGLSSPTTLGVASTGNIWVANYFSVASAFTPLGAPIFPAGITGSALYHSYGLAVDASDNAWIANEDNNTLTKLAANGTPLSGANGFSGGGIYYPLALAIDPDTSVWVVNYGEISRLSASGSPLSGPTGYASPQFNFPVAIAVDSAHNAWVANQGGLNLTRVSQDGSNILSVICCNTPSGIAIDQRGFVWATNYYGNSVSQVSSSLTIVSSGYTDPALNRPQGIAIDGSGNVWVANYRGLGITELAGSQSATPGASFSPAAGWAHDAPLLASYSLAIDASGNLWIANFGSSTITQIIGLAAPVKTPVVGPTQTP